MLTRLPRDILAQVVVQLAHIKDLVSLTRTCRTLHARLPEVAPPNAILRLCANSSLAFVHPYPYFLVAASARRLSSVCLGNARLTQALLSAFQGGIDGLYEFCLERSGITLAEIRKWHLSRSTTVRTLSDHVEKIRSRHLSPIEDWDDDLTWGWSCNNDPDLTTMQFLIYGELFGTSLEVFLDPQHHIDSQMVKPHFGLEVRLEYVKYCIPDWQCWGYQGLNIEQTGPYRHTGKLRMRDLTALCHALYSTRWRRLWRPILRQVGPDFWDEAAEEQRLKEADGFTWTPRRQQIALDKGVQQRRQLLWWNSAVLTGGLDGASAIDTMNEEGAISDGARSRLSELRRKIEALTDEQLMGIESNVVGTRDKIIVAQIPDLAKETAVCMRTLWLNNEEQPYRAWFIDLEEEDDNEGDDEGDDDDLSSSDDYGSDEADLGGNDDCHSDEEDEDDEEDEGEEGEE